MTAELRKLGGEPRPTTTTRTRHAVKGPPHQWHTVLLGIVLLFAIPAVSAQTFSPSGTQVLSTEWESLPTESASSAISTLTSASATSAGGDLGSLTKITMTKSPTPSQTANIGAQTYIVNTPSAALDAFLDTSHPVLVVDFDYNVTSLSVIINLVADEGVDAPSTYVSADPESAGEEPPEPNYYPGNTRVAPDSGGTSYGGYNRRKGGTWQVVYDRGFANWTYGYTLAAGPVANPAPVRPSILIGLGIDADITYNPELVNDVPVRVVILIDTEFTEGSAALSPAYPYVGDSTSSEAILFSPVLYHSKLPQPSYPNYTFPSAELDMAVWDELEQTTGDSNFVFGSNSSISLIALPTDKSTYPLGLANSAYALLYLLDTLNETSKIIVDGAIGQATNWTTIGGDQGYRYWEVYTGLEPNTSYVVWTLSTPSSGSWNLVLTQPVFFTTKSTSFPCSLLPPTDLCPGVAYSVPFTKDAPGDSTVTLPDTIFQTLTANLDAFTLSLGASGVACGRDMYSYTSTCLDCANAYREWLCHIVLPRCSEEHSFQSASVTATNAPTAVSAVPRTTDAPRNKGSSYPTYPFNYDEMLPCISVCTLVERKCPPNLQWACPHRNFNAKDSYAFIGPDTHHGDGTAARGYPAQDVWGNRWCSG